MNNDKLDYQIDELEIPDYFLNNDYNNKLNELIENIN